MEISNIRVLVLCLAIGLGLGIVAGSIYAVVADKLVAYGIGTALLVLGLIALALGLLGATEPPEGWSLKRRAPESETPRRSLAARATYEAPNLSNRVSAISLVVWAVVVGGGLILFSSLAFFIAP